MRTLIFLISVCLWSSTVARADLYQWTDADGVIHVVDEATEVPPAYQEQVKVHRAAKPAATTRALPLSPSRAYSPRSQGAFAQKLALDLGLIRSKGEDALGPLGGAGIHPAGGWQVGDPLTLEEVDEISEAARRAAASLRLSLSADGAEAVVRQVATAFLPPVEETPPAPSPQQVIIQQLPPQVVEVEREPVREIIIQDPIYIPVPVGRPHHHHPQEPHDGHHAPRPPTGQHTTNWDVPLDFSPQSPHGPHTVNPAPTRPTHMPFGTSHMPFGASHMPFGTSHMPFGSSRSHQK